LHGIKIIKKTKKGGNPTNESRNLASFVNKLQMNYLTWKKPVVKSAFDWDLNSYKNGQLIDFLDLPDPPAIHLYDEQNNKIDNFTCEYPEQCLAFSYVDEDATVLELGARYGTVSCIINKKLINKQNQVSVEPDYTVWDALEKNIQRNKCSIQIHKGFVSKKTRNLLPYGYAATSIVADSSTIPSASVEDIETMYNLTFNTLVADCEGFLEEFFDEHPHLYDQLHTVLFEADYPQKCNYSKIRQELKSHGFREIISGFQNVFKK
jgi:FkbM family methyltransferase